jgi:hypothetical protein
VVWITLRIAVLYGAPIAAVAAAIAYFALLLVRVRRGALGRARAAALYPLALLLAPAALAVVWVTAELASYFSVPAGGYAWDASEALALVYALLPIAGYVGIPVAALTVAFWFVLWAGRNRWKR